MKTGRDAQPLSRIEWVHRDDLHANSYNPNKVAKPELELLKVSILEDGWTQPIVARPDEVHLSFPCLHSSKITYGETPPWMKEPFHQLRSLRIPLDSWMERGGLPGVSTDPGWAGVASQKAMEAKNSANGSNSNGELATSASKRARTVCTSGTLTDSTTSDGFYQLSCPICGSSGRVPKNFWQPWMSGPGEKVEDAGLTPKTALSEPIGRGGMAKSLYSSPTDAAQTPSCSEEEPSVFASQSTAFLNLSVSLEIVDGFHRWTVSADPRLYAMTGGFVPVVRLSPPATGDQMLSTIRHNRARGEHGVLPMAEIVRALIDEEGLTPEEVMTRCGMEKEEVTRLYDRGGMTERGTQGKEGFSRGWVPK